MNISENKQTIRGNHNGTQFILEGGLLLCLGGFWSKKKVKNLIEIVNLLQVQGFDVIDSLPKRKVSKTEEEFRRLMGGGTSYPEEEQ